ncbi:DEAD/DEAH box helicase [Bradyrhizobium neotropicale]|nr:DEAD/DEAH box helicase [Bradyrhizobium neotropicale]
MLRPQQTNLIQQIDQAIADGCRRIMVQAPTGFGKTIIAGTIAGKILDAEKRAIFTVPALSLVDQTVEKFFHEGIYDVGVIQAQHYLTNYARPIQVASVQTLQRRAVPAADLVMIDEAHRWFEFYGEWLKRPEWADVPFIGLSATPWTRGLGKYFDKLIIAATTAELIEAGYLSRFRVFAPASPDLSDVRTVAGDYHEGDLSKAMDKSALVADVIDTWIERGRGRPTLCFAVDRAHAKNLQQKFIAADIVAEYIDAYTAAPDREAIAKRFHKGEVEVVCNVGCLTTGIDWDVRCIILARPTKSEMLFVQMIGRGLRTADGKDDCLILDHSDNHIRLGFVTDISHDKLDDGRERQKAEPKAKEALPKKCPKCTFLKPPKTPICPACGFKPEPKCDIVNNEGELIELASRTSAKASTQQDRAFFYAELRWIEWERNYKKGWAAHQYKNKFGSFPPWGWNQSPTCTPTASTLSWIRSRQIAFAKRRAS